MAEVAQLVEHLVVAQVAVGSSPIFRPINFRQLAQHRWLPLVFLDTWEMYSPVFLFCFI